MEYWEFHELAEQIAQELEPRIGEDNAFGIGSAIAGGETGIAVEEMVYAVIAEQIPVTGDELDKLRVLAGNLNKESAKFLAMLDQVKPI